MDTILNKLSRLCLNIMVVFYKHLFEQTKYVCRFMYIEPEYNVPALFVKVNWRNWVSVSLFIGFQPVTTHITQSSFVYGRDFRSKHLMLPFNITYILILTKHQLERLWKFWNCVFKYRVDGLRASGFCESYNFIHHIRLYGWWNIANLVLYGASWSFVNVEPGERFLD